MIMTIEHCWQPKGLHIRYLNTVTGEALVQAALDVGGDERFDSLRYVISDWSQCCVADVGVEDVEQLAAYIAAMARSNPRIYHLNVMRADLNNQAFINLYMFLTDEIPWQVTAYRSLAEARDWLQGNLAISESEMSL